jgi:rRNA maturation endonuclease Nob1
VMQAPRRTEPLERLVCEGCDRSFPSLDPEAMLAAIKGACPDCGGRFELNGTEASANAPPSSR